MVRGSAKGAKVSAAAEQRPTLELPTDLGAAEALLQAATRNPDLAWQLSSNIPALLKVAESKAVACLSQFTGPSSSSSSSSSSGSSNSRKRGTSSSSGRGARPAVAPALAQEMNKLLDWDNNAQCCYQCIIALSVTERLPAQQVLEQFSSPAAAAQYVGWMEELAGRMLVYSQQPGSSSDQRGNEFVIARLLKGQLPCWEDLAFGLLRTWNLLQSLHYQCLLAASPEAAGLQARVVDPSSGGGACTGTSSHQLAPAGSSSDGDGSGSGSGSEQCATTSSAAGGGGMSWSWSGMTAAGGDVVSALSLQVQAAWLRPNLVTLLDAWLHRIQAKQVDIAANMRDNTRAWAEVLTAPNLHPALAQLGYSGPAAAAAAAQLGSVRPVTLQAMAWSYLATGSAMLRQQVLTRLQQVPRKSFQLHPTLQRCPSYHKGRSYADGMLRALLWGDYYVRLPEAYELHLLGCEVWDLWPWQLKLLQEYQQQHTLTIPTATTATTTTTTSSSSRDQALADHGRLADSSTATSNPGTSSSTQESHGVTLPGLHSALWPLLPHTVSPMLPHHRSSADSSSDSSCDHGRGATTGDGGQVAAVSTHLPPVSADQLHLALERVCLNVQLSTYHGNNSLQLLVLLLVRADPALRLAFLQGPQGGLLLAALQLYGCGRTALHAAVAAIQPELVQDSGMGWLCSQGLGMKGLREVLFHDTTLDTLPHASTAVLALSWLLLRPKDSREGSDGSSSSSSSSCTASGIISSTIAWSPGPLVRFGSEEDAAGGLPLIKIPAAALQLLPGYTPHLQLAATLETLLLQGGDPSVLLGALADAYQQDPSRAPPPGSPMWLALASMAVGVRKHAAAVSAQSVINKEGGMMCIECLGCLLPLLRLAAVAQQQPGACWGALVLGSAVQGAALACCAAALSATTASGLVLQLRRQFSQSPQGISQVLVAERAEFAHNMCTFIVRLVDVEQTKRAWPAAAPATLVFAAAVSAVTVAGMATAGVPSAADNSVAEAQPEAASVAESASAADAAASGMLALTEAAEPNPQPMALVAPVGLPRLLMEARHLLAALSSSWPGGQTAAGAGSLSPSAAITSTAAAGTAAGAAAGAAAAAGGASGAAAVNMEALTVATGSPGVTPAADAATTPPAPAAGRAAAAAAAAKAASPGTNFQPPGPITTAPFTEPDLSSPTNTGPAPPAPFPPHFSGCADTAASSHSGACTEALAHVQDAQRVCEAAAACARVCSSRLQLLGCANLGCTTPPAAGLGGCEASLVVNCRGSVCGGCGAVRYCSAACAQQDWAGHRRVCRRLAAAAARGLRKAAELGGVGQ